MPGFSSVSTWVLMTAEKWQTLIGAFIALFAAIIALRPVYGQLKAANLQAAVAMRGVLADKIRLLETRRDKLFTQSNKLLSELVEYERIGRPQIFQWAWNMETQAFDYQSFLDEVIEDKIETDQAGIALSDLRKITEDFTTCLFNVNLEQHLEIGHSEVSDNDKKLADEAEKDLGGKITELRLANDGLREAYTKVLDELRIKIRSLDETIRKQIEATS